MDALKTIGIALISGFGGYVGVMPLEIPAEQSVAEERPVQPTEAAIVAVVVGPVVALIVAIALYQFRQGS